MKGRNRECIYLELRNRREIENGLLRLAGKISDVDVKLNDEGEEAKQGEEDEGMDENGGAAGLEGAELDESTMARDLKEKAWGEKKKQNHSHKNWAPIRHCFPSLASFGFLCSCDVWVWVFVFGF